MLGRFCRIHDLQAVKVLQLAARHHAGQRGTVADDIDLQGRALGQTHGQAHAEGQGDGGVDEHLRAQHPAQHLGLIPAVFHAVLRGKADQSARQLHLVHHTVASIHAQAAANALVLQAVANVDAHGADLHAQGAVDAIAQRRGGGAALAFAAHAARFAALAVVGDDQRVLVQHGALEAGIGAHVFAHLLTQETGVAVGGQAVKANPEDLPRPLQRHDFHRQSANWHEVADKGKSRPQRQQQPAAVLGAAFEDFL